MATFKLELAPYANADGEQKVRIRITVNRTLKRVDTGVRIDKKYWNEESNEVRRSHPSYAQINAAIKSKLFELQEVYLNSLTRHKQVSASKLQSAVTNPYTVSQSFFEYMENKIDRFPSASTRKSQTSILKKLKEFCKGQDLRFEEITPDFLSRYKLHLEKVLGNSPNTVHLNIVKLKTAYEEAVADGVYEYEKTSPFKRIRLKKTKSTRTKLSIEDIHNLSNLELPAGHLRHAKNLFLFSFYLQGIRASDLLQLTWKAVSDDRLYYTASKTKKSRSRLILPVGLKILEEYRDNSTKLNDYIFPYLKPYKRKSQTEDEWLRTVDSKISQVRTNLNKIGRMIGLEKLSLHVARHTFADIARKKTGNIYLISDALDHSDLSTTENYFALAKNEENDDFIKSIFEQ